MITNHELVIEYIAQWLADYAKAAGKSVFVVGYRGTRPDALLLHVCSKATEVQGGLSTHALHFPIHPGEITKDIFNGPSTYSNKFSGDEDCYLKCHNIAGDNGIVVGPIDRSFGLYYRSYGKRAEAVADIFPLFDLEYQDIKDLVDNIWPDREWSDVNTQMYCSLFSSPSLASDLDFCAEAEAKYGIITNEQTPNKHSHWPYFIHHQKEMIAMVHQREKSTRHKKLDRPYAIISDKPQLMSRR